MIATATATDRLLHTVQGAFLGSTIVLLVMFTLAYTSSPDSCSKDANRIKNASYAMLSMFCALQCAVSLMYYRRKKEHERSMA